MSTKPIKEMPKGCVCDKKLWEGYEIPKPCSEYTQAFDENNYEYCSNCLHDKLCHSPYRVLFT
jgi:hypothetical protein